MSPKTLVSRTVCLVLLLAVITGCAAPAAPTAAPAGAAVAAPTAEPVAVATAAPAAKALTLRIGRFPNGAGAAFVTVYMRDHQLIEKAGKELGYDLTVEWQDFPTAVPVVQALTAGQLDIGPMGSTAGLNLIAGGQAVTPISNAEGHFKVVVVTRPDSDVRSLEDLKGKTVAVAVGTDLYNIFAEMLLGTFGSADPAQAGINIVNVSTPAQLAAVPQGSDAAIVTNPAFLKAHDEVGTVAIVNSYGYTESYYKGVLGEGAGLLIPSAEKSVFWPEGYYGHRALFIARDAVIKENPKAVAAFLVAQQRAIDALRQMSAEEVAALCEKDWGLPAAMGKEIVSNDLLMTRGWAFLTEGDAKVLNLQVGLLVKNEVIKEAIPWATLAEYLGKSGEVAKIAWETLGSKPSMDEMLDISIDKRGNPTWETAKWVAPN